MTRWLIIWCVFVVGPLNSNTVLAAENCSRENTSACSAEHICFYAKGTNPIRTSPQGWSTFASWTPYVIEAKKRGLTCGLQFSATAGNTSNLQAAFSKLSKFQKNICKQSFPPSDTIDQI